MSAEADPEPVKADGEILGYECADCGTMKKTEAQAATHCDDSKPEPELEPGPESAEAENSLPRAAIRDHHHRIESAVAPLGAVDGSPTLAVTDKRGWYITRENTDPGEEEIGEYPKERRARNFATDYGDVVDTSLERTLYALTSYKRPEAFENWEPARFDEDDGAYEYLNEKPTPTIEDITAISVWGDIDLADDLKPERFDLDEGTYATAEAALTAYIDAFADLYGGRDAVYALDSVGGVYVFGAPEATLPITRHYEDDADARERVLSAFIERSNEYLQDAEADINGRVEGASETISPDWANNLNRQYKIPLTIHSDHDAVVTPLDVEDVRYREPVAVADVDESLLDETREWCESLTALDFEERVEDLVATLWPDEFEEHDDWKATLDAWVEAERKREEREELRRQAERERRKQRREEIGDGLEGHSITPFMQEVHDDLDDTDTGKVIKKHASDAWDTGTDESGKTEFDPSWRKSSSGSSCYVNHIENRFGDPSDSGGGYAAKAMALGEGIITNASDDLEGKDWGDAVAALRKEDYDIRLWTPEKGSKDRDGEEFEEMPFWSVRKAAVALGSFPEDGFVEKTNDDGSTYPGFPGPESYNNALDAIEEAGLEHGRERADTGPQHPVYELLADKSIDLELHLRPISGKEAEVVIMRDGNEAYSETQERGFWNNGTKRSRVAGRVKDEIQAFDAETLVEDVKHVLVKVSRDSKEDWFEESMRSYVERSLRDRTIRVVCWPGEESTEWVVTMLPPDSSPENSPQTFNFDNGQITNADPGYFRSLHTGAFFEKVTIDAEEWANLTTYWLDIQETKRREADPRKEAAIEQFLSKVEVMTVWAEQDGFDWSGRNGLYRPDYADGHDAILVPGRWVMDWLNDSDYSDLNLSKILRERGVMVRAAEKEQINGQQNRAWPIAAAETGHTYENSHRPRDADDDDAPEDLR